MASEDLVMKTKLPFDLCIKGKNLNYMCCDTGQAETFNFILGQGNKHMFVEQVKKNLNTYF